MWLFASCDACFDMNLGKISAKVFEAKRGDAAVNGRPGLKISISEVIRISSNQALRRTVQHFTSFILVSNHLSSQFPSTDISQHNQ
jgi:hypothetical protein